MRESLKKIVLDQVTTSLSQVVVKPIIFLMIKRIMMSGSAPPPLPPKPKMSQAIAMTGLKRNPNFQAPAGEASTLASLLQLGFSSAEALRAIDATSGGFVDCLKALSTPPLQSASVWRQNQVVEYFRALGQDNADAIFGRHQVDGRTLLLLNEEDLRELGLSFGPIRKHLDLKGGIPDRADVVLEMPPQFQVGRDAENAQVEPNWQNMSFEEKCRYSEEHSSCSREERCLGRFCMVFWLVVMICGAAVLIALSLRSFFFILFIPGIVCGVIALILAIMWPSFLCCDKYWCCSCK